MATNLHGQAYTARKHNKNKETGDDKMSSKNTYPSGLNHWIASDKPELQDFLNDNETLTNNAMWKKDYDKTGSVKAAGGIPAYMTANLAGTLPIEKGGTGATAAADARGNLGALASTNGVMNGSLYFNNATGQRIASLRSTAGDYRVGFWALAAREHSGVELWTDGTADQSFNPRKDNCMQLGYSGVRWNAIYATTGTINTSDATKKNSIQELDEERALAFLRTLQAKSYKFNENESGRTHYGFIAQDVEALLGELGINSLDFAGFIKSPRIVEKYTTEKMMEADPVTGKEVEISAQVSHRVVVPDEYDYGLRYEEFIPILWRGLQCALGKVDALEKKLNQQTSATSELTGSP